MTEKCKYCGEEFIPSRACAEDDYTEQCRGCQNVLFMESLIWNEFIYELYIKSQKNVDKSYIIKRLDFIKSIKQLWNKSLQEQK